MKTAIKKFDQFLFGGKFSQRYREWRIRFLERRGRAAARRLHHYFYELHAYEETWMGVRSVQNPLDMWMKQKLIAKTRPQFLIETGTYHGGTALFYAMLLEALGEGHVITIDPESHLAAASQQPLFSKRVTSLQGLSTHPDILSEVSRRVGSQTAMVILDSNHSKQNVLTELKLYSRFVKPGHYIVVDDTQLNGHPVNRRFGEGPFEAVQEFLKKNREFEVDRDCEKFMFTFNPSGYLRRREAGK